MTMYRYDYYYCVIIVLWNVYYVHNIHCRHEFKFTLCSHKINIRSIPAACTILLYTVEPLNMGHVVGGSTVQQPVVHAPASIMFISYKMKVFLNISIHSI